MRKEIKFTFLSGYNWCFPEYSSIYDAMDENDLGDFIDFCDHVTEIEDSLYDIDLLFTDEKEYHKDYIVLTYLRDAIYCILGENKDESKSHWNFTELVKHCHIDSSKYIYVKTTLIPENKKEKYPPIIEGRIYSLDFKFQGNHWLVDTPPFKDIDLSSFATIWDLFEVIASDTQSFALNIICTKKRESHKGWIELYENSGFTYNLEVLNLEGYKRRNPIFLSSKVIDVIGFYPKYIYLKKI